MGETKGARVQFNSTTKIGTGNDKVSLKTLIETISTESGNEGTLYFTQGDEAKIILNGADYTGYHKPADGIPQSDLTEDLRNKINNASGIVFVSTLPSASEDTRNKIYCVVNGPIDIGSNTRSDPNTRIEENIKAYVTKRSGNPGIGYTYTWLGLESHLLENIVITRGYIDVTPPAGDSSKKIADTEFVQQEIDRKLAAADALVFKGVKAGGGTTTPYGALTPAANAGDTYKVSVSGKIDGIAVEVGDLLICTEDGTIAATADNWSTVANKWTVVQGNIDGAVTGPASAVGNQVAIFDGTTGKIIKDSGFTIEHSVPSNPLFTDEKVSNYSNHYDQNNTTLGGQGTTVTSSNQGILTGIIVDERGHVRSVVGKELTPSDIPGVEVASNKATSWSSTPSNTKYPSEKLTKDTLDTKIDKVSGATNGHLPTLNSNGNIVDSGVALPANPIFTDEHVTSAANHFTPDKNTNNPEYFGNSDPDKQNIVFTSIKTDRKGHIIGVADNISVKTVRSSEYDSDNVSPGGGTGVETISRITQDTNGDITVEKEYMPIVSEFQYGILSPAMYADVLNSITWK